jgi:hypothetical protein
VNDVALEGNDDRICGDGGVDGSNTVECPFNGFIIVGTVSG